MDKIDLGQIATIDQINFGRDRLNSFNDRDPGQFLIEVATIEGAYSNGNDTNDANEYTEIFNSAALSFSGLINYTETIQAAFDAVDARYIKMSFTGDGVAIDEIEVFQSSVVPVPAAVWLFGSGLLGLVSIARRKKAA